MIHTLYTVNLIKLQFLKKKQQTLLSWMEDVEWAERIHSQTHITDSESTLNITDPWYNASISDPGGNTSFTDPGCNVDTSDQGGNTNLTDPWCNANTSDPGGNTNFADPWCNANTSDPGGNTNFTDPGCNANTSDPGGNTNLTDPGCNANTSDPGGNTNFADPGCNANTSDPGGNTNLTDPWCNANTSDPGGNTNFTDPESMTDIESEIDNDDCYDSDYVPDSESEWDEEKDELDAPEGNQNVVIPWICVPNDNEQDSGKEMKEEIMEDVVMSVDEEIESSSSSSMEAPSSHKERLSSLCSHEILDESLIERDEKHPKIYVRKKLASKISATGRKKASDRVWNNYHCCFVCQKLSTNITKHLLTHKNNEETKELILLKNSKKEEDRARCRALQTVLRNKGDHKHNMNIKREGGELIIARKSGKFKAEHYGPCPKCLEWIKLDSYSTRHQSVCPAVKANGKKMTRGEVIVNSSIVLGDVTEDASKKVVAEVYPIMTRDEITECAKNDPLIVSLGNNWHKRNLGNKLKRKYYTSTRMRGAARLLQHLRTLSGTNGTMMDFLTPGNFDHVCEAALLCAHIENDDEEDLRSPSTALKIGFDIGRMASIKLGIALRSGNQDQKKEAEDFSKLIKMEWSTRVSKLAYLKLREDSMKKPQKSLPIPEDLSVLGGRVVAELKNLKWQRNFETYRRAVMLLETRLLTYNKRRSGELEALSLENYTARSKGLDEADRALLGSDMTDLERYLVESQELIKIRGKNGKIVPILVPEDSKKALEFVTSADVRRTVGIKCWNNYVFANTGEGVMRAYDSLKAICGELKLTAPDRITSVSMRKYIATLSQVIDMKDFELEWLCNHLGHTASVHKLHYRSTSGFIERVNIGKLMLLQDLNIAGKYAGQRLQDIDLTDAVYPPTEDVDAIGDSYPPTKDVDAIGDQKVDEDILEDDHVPRKKAKLSTRQAWTKAEEDELEKLFISNFESKKNPGLKECTQAIAKSRNKKGVIHLRSWETIKKKVMRMIQKKSE